MSVAGLGWASARLCGVRQGMYFLVAPEGLGLCSQATSFLLDFARADQSG